MKEKRQKTSQKVIRISNYQYQKILKLKKKKSFDSMADTLDFLLKTAFENEKIEDALANIFTNQLQEKKHQLDAIESKIDKIENFSKKSASGSLGTLGLLSFLMDDVEVVLNSKLTKEEDRKIKFWSKQGIHKIYSFFKNFGDNLSYAKNKTYWEALYYPCNKRDFQDQSLEDITGIDESKARNLIKIKNSEAEAIRNLNKE